MVRVLVLLSFLLLSVARATNSCIWTKTHCACSKKTELLGNSVCYDVIGDIPGSLRKKCSSRKCRESFVCDCNGESYCEHSTEEKEVLVLAAANECKIEERVVTAVSLVTANISEVHSSIPGNARNCIFSDTQCTCASTTDIGITQDCLDFLYEDPVRGSICRVRDCRDSMQCDCGGSHTCSRAKKTSFAWKMIANEGRPGLAVCERFNSTTYNVTEEKSDANERKGVVEVIPAATPAISTSEPSSEGNAPGPPIFADDFNLF